MGDVFFRNPVRHYCKGGYSSPSMGGTTEPQVGDLYFYSNPDDDNYPSPGHIGIIVAVDGNNIDTVEGNWSKRVAQRTISKNDVSFVSFARPAYTSSYTTPIFDSDGEGHTPICADCGLVNWYGFEEHVYTSFKGSASGHWSVCSICGFGFPTSITAHRYGSAYDYSDTFHWKVCLDCGYPDSTRTPHAYTTDIATGIKTCVACGYEVFPSIGFGTEDPEPLIE